MIPSWIEQKESNNHEPKEYFDFGAFAKTMASNIANTARIRPS